MQGLHLTADLRGCRPDAPAMVDAPALRALCVAAVARCGLTAVGELFHRFDSGGGVTGVVLLAESHLAVHTWPELQAVTLDVYTRDTWNLIALPYFKYDSNSGLLLALRGRDYNFFGTMQTLTLNLDYFPNSGATYSQIALGQAQKGDTASALATIEKGLQVAPDHPQLKRAQAMLKGQRP